MAHKKTLWPLGILLIIVLGIILITVSIRISTKQSIDTDHTYDMKRLSVNTHINEIMTAQNQFEHVYEVRVGINNKLESEASIINSPYYATPVPKDSTKEKDVLVNGDNEIYLFFQERAGVENTFEIKDITLEFVRLVQGDKEVTSLNVPVKKIDNTVYKTDFFSLPLKGYYQARFKIETLSLSMQEDLKYPIYFYHWVFNSVE